MLYTELITYRHNKHPTHFTPTLHAHCSLLSPNPLLLHKEQGSL